MSNALVWLRNDLRLADNPALQAALDGGHTPIPVYIHAPSEHGDWPPGAASNAWLHHSLVSLSDALAARGSRLRLFVGPSLETLRTLVAATDARAVFWNRRYEPALEQRDTRIKKALRSQGLEVESFNSALLFEPWTVSTRQGTPFRVFTPFWKAALADWRIPACGPAPDSVPSTDAGPSGVPLEALKLSPDLGWDTGFWTAWQPGEAGASEALEAFVEGALHAYADDRDRPDRVGTSRLSPHLHFGEISPWRVVHALEAARTAATSRHVDTAIKELGWREFAHHLLHHFPETPGSDFNPRFEGFKWVSPSRADLDAWRQGRTGVPIVDAGLRELWATGWMHNRVRMIVGSWLTKHMRVHWWHGARWFWDTLVDADLASNTLGWQWVAGTGADAAPYFRVFNPVTQAERFDPQGGYIARWVPELACLPVPLRFAPWRDPATLASRAPDYPQQPIVDLAEGRDAALAAYRRQRERVARVE